MGGGRGIIFTGRIVYHTVRKVLLIGLFLQKNLNGKDECTILYNCVQYTVILVKYHRARHITNSQCRVQKTMKGTGEVWGNENPIYFF